MKQRIMWILWPAFVVAAVAEMLFFAFIDPGELHLFGNPIELSKTATYSLFFFLFWVMGACSSALTCFLQGGGQHVSTDEAERGSRT
jgi:Na+-driven multidrug efflux pump